MNILVCVKRVPAPGAKIIVTDDGSAVDTAHLGFTTSPHEECAIEEAVQRSLARWEPRIQLENVKVETDPGDPASQKWVDSPACSRFLLVAAIMRTSTFKVLWPPTRSNSFSWRIRSRLA